MDFIVPAAAPVIAPATAPAPVIVPAAAPVPPAPMPASCACHAGSHAGSHAENHAAGDAFIPPIPHKDIFLALFPPLARNVEKRSTTINIPEFFIGAIPPENVPIYKLFDIKFVHVVSSTGVNYFILKSKVKQIVKSLNLYV